MKNQRSRAEGKAVKKITVRLTDEKWKKLEAVMVKLGVGRVKDGEVLSDKLRELIDKLHYYHVVANRSQIGINKPKFLTKASDTRVCPMDGSQVSVASFCSKCHDKTPEIWRKCSAMLADQGIGGTGDA